MSRRRFTLSLAVVAVSITAFTSGCGVNVTALTDLLSSIDADTTLGELLNKVTVGDLVTAFQQFVSDVGDYQIGPLGSATLTDEQIAELESLQAQLDAGEITSDEFMASVQEIIGDAGAGIPFAGFRFFGGPFVHRACSQDAAALELTEDQRAQAEEIFDSAHEDIDALREEAKDNIRALLTEEQLVLLDEMPQRGDGPPAPPGRLRGPSGPPGHGDGRLACQQMYEDLDLTEEQWAAIETIREELRDAVIARHEQAREEFLAILTEEQLAILDELSPQNE